MCLHSIIDFLKLLMELSKVGFNSSEGFVLLKTEELFVQLTPLQIVHPVGGIWFLVNVS
jgi:hypothetical protein